MRFDISARAFTFRLRSVFVALVILCGALACVAQHWRAVRAEVVAASRLRTATYKHWRELPADTVVSGRAWLVTNYGSPIRQPNFLSGPVTLSEALTIWRSPVSVHLESVFHQVTDDEIELCNAFRRLAMLRISYANLSDKRFARLTATQYLERLELDVNPLHDESAIRIGRMTSLKFLTLSSTDVTDAGVCHFVNLRHLEHLNLSDNAAVTDHGICCLSSCKSLRWIYLNGTSITDDALLCLSAIPCLSHLSVDGTKVTDKGIRHLANSPSRETIEYLGLSDTKVTDDVLPILAQFPRLGGAILKGTAVDPDKAEEFMNSLHPITRPARS